MTTPAFSIRDETPDDAVAITRVTEAAFANLEISGHTEQFIVQALRSTGALSISLVAEIDGSLVGHIAFSPVRMSDGAENWYGLGPMSVLPAFQRQGIGGALIDEGLLRLRAMGAAGCCLVGHPQYYRRFGFENTDSLAYEGVPPEAFFVLPLNGVIPRGSVAFHEAFSVTGENMDTGNV